MGEILKQCIVIEYKQVTDRPLTDIYKVVFLYFPKKPRN